MDFPEVESETKRYSAPKLDDLPLEQAKLFLLNHAASGDLEAKYLLDLLTETST